MKNFSHPNFILGIISLILLFVGVGMRANSFRSGDIVWIITIGLGAIHWIWSIVDVLKDYKLKNDTEDRNILWVLLVIIIPPVGGLLYYGYERKIRM